MNGPPEVLSTARADVLEFCRRFTVVCDGLTEEQCRALKDSGALSALTRVIVAIRAGQKVIPAITQFVGAVRGLVSKFE